MKEKSFSPFPDESQQPCLGTYPQRWAAKYGSHIALVNQNGEKLSYLALAQQVEKIANGLYAAGLRAGDHAMIQLPNTFGFFTVFFALLRLGVIPVLAMPNQREKDINILMGVAAPVAYFIPDEQENIILARKMKSAHPSLRLIVTEGEFVSQDEDILHLGSLFGPTFPQPDQNAQNTALLVLSGGTTGTPKLIPRTHADYFYAFSESAKLCGFDAQTVFLAVLPTAHNFTLISPGVLGTFESGGRVVITLSPSCDEAMPLIETERVTHVALVPPLAKLWVEGRKWESSDLSSLKVIQVGGARLEASLAKQLRDVMGCQIQQVFGMAEGLLCYTRLDDPLETILHTQGRPLSRHDEIRIIDEENCDVPDGQIGQLLTRGPYTIRGYFRAPEQNALSFTEDGFYRSGDLVRRDSHGNLIVEGRIKEQINRSGEKVAAAEVEMAINTLIGIHSSIAVGVPDALLGERICVFIHTEDQVIDPTRIKAQLRECGVSYYKIPDQIEMIEHWPLTAARKIDKQLLVAIAKQRAGAGNRPECYQQEVIPISDSPFHLAVKLVEQMQDIAGNCMLYERKGEWALGINTFIEITVESDGTVRRSDGKTWHSPSPGLGIEKALANLSLKDWRVYGTANFEFAYLTYGVENKAASKPIIKLFIPCCEIRLFQGTAQLRALKTEDMAWMKELVVKAGAGELPKCKTPISIDLRSAGGEYYKKIVASAVEDMGSHRYQKVILSRSADVPLPVDMVASYYAGRQANTPARSFWLKDGQYQAYGFSPEIVLSVDTFGNVTTQPVAGTRALTGNIEVDKRLRKDLECDIKEIAEHAVSVKQALQEMSQTCRKGTVKVDEFMNVLERGSVQHLASLVKGVLAPNNSAWRAFETLFPAVTVSGIPKREALMGIRQYESTERGLYSGCVLIAESNGAFDAALVLRSTYFNGKRCWIQAGAGLVSHSKPEREWEETNEKLASVGAYLFSPEAVESTA